jgi:hypothetical protein
MKDLPVCPWIHIMLLVYKVGLGQLLSLSHRSNNCPQFRLLEFDASREKTHLPMEFTTPVSSSLPPKPAISRQALGDDADEMHSQRHAERRGSSYRYQPTRASSHYDEINRENRYPHGSAYCSARDSYDHHRSARALCRQPGTTRYGEKFERQSNRTYLSTRSNQDRHIDNHKEDRKLAGRNTAPHVPNEVYQYPKSVSPYGRCTRDDRSPPREHRSSTVPAFKSIKEESNEYFAVWSATAAAAEYPNELDTPNMAESENSSSGHSWGEDQSTNSPGEELYTRGRCTRPSKADRDLDACPNKPFSFIPRNPSLQMPKAVDVKTIEVAPGENLRLRGATETWQAIQCDFYMPCECSCCNNTIFCIQDADFVLCPDCRVVSPARYDDVLHRTSGGVGLGFKMENLAQWQTDIESELRAMK